MRNVLLAVLAVSCLVVGPVRAQPKKDAPNCSDHPSFSRLPEYRIEACTQKPSDTYSFYAGSGRNEVKGRYWQIRYLPPAGLKVTTQQALASAAATVKKAGGVLVASDASKETLKLAGQGKETWVEVWADYTGKYILTIVERAAPAPVAAASASAPPAPPSPPASSAPAGSTSSSSSSSTSSATPTSLECPASVDFFPTIEIRSQGFPGSPSPNFGATPASFIRGYAFNGYVVCQFGMNLSQMMAYDVTGSAKVVLFTSQQAYPAGKTCTQDATNPRKYNCN